MHTVSFSKYQKKTESKKKIHSNNNKKKKSENMRNMIIIMEMEQIFPLKCIDILFQLKKIELSWFHNKTIKKTDIQKIMEQEWYIMKTLIKQSIINEIKLEFIDKNTSA